MHKGVPKGSLAGATRYASITIVADQRGKVNPSGEKKTTIPADAKLSARETAGSVIDMTAPSVYHDKSTYKPTRREKAIDLADRTYAELFNAQVGVEKALRGMGMSRAEAEAEKKTRMLRSVRVFFN